jgi:transposase-like protein
MEIITGVERRRRWSVEEKLRIVAESEQPGSGIAEIARRYEISRGLLWNWGSQVRRGVLRPDALPVFLPVQTIREPANGGGVGMSSRRRQGERSKRPTASSRSRCLTEHQSRLGMMSVW